MQLGDHTLEDGWLVEAGQFEAKASSFQTVTFSNAFRTAPVVLAAVTSFNESDTIVTRTRNVSTNGFQPRMQEEKANLKSHAAEVISYITWKPSSGTVDGIAFEANRTPDAVKHNPCTIQYQQLLAEMPVFLAARQTQDGGDTANLR